MSHLNEQDVDLFLATVGAFVAARPEPPRHQPFSLNKTAEDVILDNRTEELRFELGRLPHSLPRVRAAQILSRLDLEAATEALTAVLQLMESCVEHRNHDSGHHAGFPNLEVLKRDRLRGGAAVRVMFFRPEEGTTAALQYYQIIDRLQTFNAAMAKVFGTRDNGTNTIHRSDTFDHATKLNVKRTNDLIMYKHFSATTEAMIAILEDRHTQCPQKHTTYVNLNKCCATGDKVLIETIVTVCERHKEEGCRSIFWIKSSDDIPLRRLPKEQKICDTLRNPNRTKRLCIQLDVGGSWKEVIHGLTNLNLSSEAHEPDQTLAKSLQLVNGEVTSTSLMGTLREDKWDRLDLASKVVRSVLCLIGSPLASRRWRPQDIFVCRTNAAHEKSPGSIQLYLKSTPDDSKNYLDVAVKKPRSNCGESPLISMISILQTWITTLLTLFCLTHPHPVINSDQGREGSAQPGDTSTSNIRTPTDKHRILLDISALLFSLLFLRDVEIAKGDEERGDSNELQYESSMHNALVREFEDYPRETFIQEEYLEVIGRCLDAYNELGAKEDADFRHCVYDTIFMPIEGLIKAYSPSYMDNTHVSSIKEQLSLSKSVSRVAGVSRANQENIRSATVEGTYARTRALSAKHREENFLKLPNSLAVARTTFSPKLVTTVNNRGSIFDWSRTYESSHATEGATSWLKDLKDCVIAKVVRTRQTTDNSVRVAVLDTGLDEQHPCFQENLKSNGSTVKHRRDWTKATSVTVSDTVDDITHDQVGHGTAVCDILVRIAKVELFVGKVTNTGQLSAGAPALVAKAIEHATKSWGVHVIVLSLGFEDPDEALRQAVQYAYLNDIVIIAAASNSGSRVNYRRVAFPARMNGLVVSIRSATSQSARAAASPLPSAGDDNFMILGEAIQAACVENQSTAYFSGSSFATPVAAGIAALVIEFTKHTRTMPRALRGTSYVSMESQRVLCRYEGIRKIFRHMSAVDDFLVPNPMIVPWALFSAGRPSEDIGRQIDELMKSI